MSAHAQAKWVMLLVWKYPYPVFLTSIRVSGPRILKTMYFRRLGTGDGRWWNDLRNITVRTRFTVEQTWPTISNCAVNKSNNCKIG